MAIDKPKSKNHGRLVIASNSLGDPQDIPKKTLDWLASTDLLVVEEDRPARQALKKAGIHRSYIKFNEHSQAESLKAIKLTLQEGGTVTYLSDQGCATLCDPGLPIVQLAWTLNAAITSVPGPSSLTSAIAACPFDCSRFVFAGMLPKDKDERHQSLVKFAANLLPIVVFEAPYRLQALLASGKRALPTAKVFLAADISGELEQYHFGTWDSVTQKMAELEQKLNFVAIIKP